MADRARLWTIIGLCCLGLLALGAVPLAAATPTLALVTPAGAVPARGQIDIPVRATNLSDLGAWEFDLSYDPALLEVAGMTIQPFFGAELSCRQATQRCAVSLGPVAGAPGSAGFGAVSYGPARGAGGAGVIAVIHLRPTGRGGSTTLRLTAAQITDTAARPVAIPDSSATLTLRGSVFLPAVTR